MGRSEGIRRDHPATADYGGRRARTRQALCAKARRELGALLPAMSQSPLRGTTTPTRRPADHVTGFRPGRFGRVLPCSPVNHG